MEMYNKGIIKSSLMTKSGITHGVSTKILGNMSFDRSQQGRAPGNFQNFMAELGIDLKTSVICILPAKHTSVIARVVKRSERGRIILKPEREDREITGWSCGDLSFSNIMPDYDQGTDAAVSKSRRLYLAMPHADCAPVMLYDPKTNYFALVHAGIIGAVTNILPAAINFLKSPCRVNPGNLLAYIGPCICAKCYDPTKSRHWQHLQPKLGLLGKCFDLRAYLFNQLLESGLVESHIEITEYCTNCSKDLFFSNHTAEDVNTEGRQMTVIGLK